MPNTSTLPAEIGGYRIIKQLGEGGMGIVYLADDVLAGRKVALKVMKPDKEDHPTARERFMREARAMALIKSEYVVRLFQVGEANGQPFFAMEYLHGQSLQQYLDSGKEISLKQILRIAGETAEGLADAHQLGLVHRDIKPDNIFLEAPNAKVRILDFGLARPIAGENQLTRTGAVLGTPYYMAPEQAEGKKVDLRCDLFSLGVVLYRLAAGRLPFQGDTLYSIIFSLANSTPAPLDEVNPAMPRSLAKLVEAMLAKNPNDRPLSAREVMLELYRIRDAASTSTTMPALREPAAKARTEPKQETRSGSETLGSPGRRKSISHPRSARAKPKSNMAFAIRLSVLVGVLVVLGIILALRSNQDSGSSIVQEPSDPPKKKATDDKLLPPDPLKKKEKESLFPKDEPRRLKDVILSNAVLREGKVLLPDLSRAKLVFKDDFDGPPKSDPNAARWNENGRFCVRTHGTLWNGPYPTPGKYFACELVYRLVGTATDRGGLVIATKESPDRWRAVQLLTNAKGTFFVEPWVYESEKKRGPDPQTVTHSAIRNGSEFNTLTVIVRGFRVEVYFNGIAIANPFVITGNFSESVIVQALGSDPKGHVEFDSLKIWNIDGIRTPFQVEE